MTRPLVFPQLLELLRHDGFTAVCHKAPGQRFVAEVVKSVDAPQAADLPQHDVWYGVNPVHGPARPGRGTVDQVTGLTALYADLDVKPGGLPDFDTAWDVVSTLSGMLHSRPMATTLSGHGLQPYWPLDDHPHGSEAQVLLRRFGRLVASVAERYHGQVDTVYDLARVLRVPGSVNHKDAASPQPVLCLSDTGHPLTTSEVSEALDAYGIPAQAGDAEQLGEMLAPAEEWQWATETCPYAAAMIAGWERQDPPPARHPWLVGQATRLAAAHRNGCLTAAEHANGVAVLTAKFRAFLSASPARKEAPGEIPDAFAWGRAKVAAKASLNGELGRHTHSLIAGNPATQPSSDATDPATDEPPAAPLLREVRLTPASSITVRPVHWLWKDRIALGTLALLGGREGIGKSMVGYTLAADVTCGRLPGERQNQPKSVIVAATEDSWEHTIVPRLIAAGADLDRVFRVDVTTLEGVHTGLSLPRDLAQLRDAVQQVDAALILLDPLMSRLDTKLDSHKDAEVRVALEPLVKLADDTGVAVLGLIHVNKTASTDPLTMLMASRAFAAVARAVLFMMLDPDDETIHLLGEPKNNLGRIDLPTLTFAIDSVHVADTDEGPVWTGRVNWLGEREQTIREALEASGETAETRSATSEATDWLQDHLTSQGGTDESVSIKVAGRRAGHSERTLKRAMQRLKVTVSSEGFPRKTYWTLRDTAAERFNDVLDTSRANAGPTGPTEMAPLGPTEASRARARGEPKPWPNCGGETHKAGLAEREKTPDHSGANSGAPHARTREADCPRCGHGLDTVGHEINCGGAR